MAPEPAPRPSAPLAIPALPTLTRVRVLEGSAMLLLAQLRLHAKRVRALAANFRRETRRLSPDARAALQRIDQDLDGVAERMTTAVMVVDTAFVATLTGIDALEHLAVTVDVEYPERTPHQRVALQAESLLSGLHARHAVAHDALAHVGEQLIVSANNLAIIVGQPHAQALDQLRVIIRQMRTLHLVTTDLSSRLDVYVQNQSAALQELIPAAPSRAPRPQKEPRNP
jgi:hypothetical protein